VSGTEESRGQYHFTYGSSGKHLSQGDLIDLTPAVRLLLPEDLTKYAGADLSHVLVLTQSCDLVRRKRDRCDAAFINVAAVLPYSALIDRMIASYQEPYDKAAKVCALSAQNKLRQFVERLLNNNEEEHFYLEPDVSLGLTEAFCAILRLAAPVPVEQYDVLLASRRLSLCDVFQAKLGYLLGKLYARVGTPDWAPEHMTETAFSAKITTMLGEGTVFVEDKRLKKARSQWGSGDTDPNAILDSIPPFNRKQDVITAVLSIVQDELGAALTDDKTNELRAALNNDPDLTALLR